MKALRMPMQVLVVLLVDEGLEGLGTMCGMVFTTIAGIGTEAIIRIGTDAVEVISIRHRIETPRFAVAANNVMRYPQSGPSYPAVRRIMAATLCRREIYCTRFFYYENTNHS